MDFQRTFGEILAWGVIVILAALGAGITLITGFHLFIALILNGDGMYEASNFVAMLIGVGILLFACYVIVEDQKRQGKGGKNEDNISDGN